MLLPRCRSLILSCLILFSSAACALDSSNQRSLIVTSANMQAFRQISARILSAYKDQPRYIGSTTQWHLFLKKEARTGSGGKHFSTIFGYRIERARYPLENSWELALPSVEIDPDNCPLITDFSANKQKLFLQQSSDLKDRCLNSH